MKTLFIDCSMGAAGDMLSAALLELLPEPEKMIEKLNTLGLPGVHFKKESSVKCGITGTHLSVTVHGQEESDHDQHMHGHHVHTHHHNSLHDIAHIVKDHLPISDQVKNDVMAVYQLIAEAESNVHGVPVTEIHFHEVGTMDAIADITAVCMLMESLAPEQIIVSPIHVGSGQVRCAHGILPVPAPATSYLLQGIPMYSSGIRGELCTPTGAALLKHFATKFSAMPVMTTTAIGYGMGKKDFEAANCVRVLLGDTAEKGDMIAELSCNIDDMTAEAVGFAMETLLSAGALEVYTVPIGMKKSRPGILLCTMCRVDDKDRMIRLIFQHTTTIGIRENISNRYTLTRKLETMETIYGPIHKKVSQGYGVRREKYEYEDIASIARKNGSSIEEILSSIGEN